ncbi:Uncharacterised protein [Mycobacteroides abscessus subsp. abscessus]|nr:Uncharacterised protein [Mycobacteroides abscessus subsp. abscessus]
MAVAHFALDLGAGHQRGHRVDDQDVESAGTDQHVGDLQSLLTGVGLRDQQCIGIDTEPGRIVGIEGMLGVDECGDAARSLRVGHRVESDRRLTRRLRAVDLHDAATRQTADTERDVECDGPGRDHLDRLPALLTEAHHRTLAEVLVDLGQREVESLLAVLGSCCHGISPCSGWLRFVCAVLRAAR